MREMMLGCCRVVMGVRLMTSLLLWWGFCGCSLSSLRLVWLSLRLRTLS